MRRLHTYFLAIAVLISAFVHLFLINAAYQVTVELGLFENPTAEKLFHIKTVKRPHHELDQRSRVGPDKAISFERPGGAVGRSEAEIEDRRKLLAERGLISFDASEAEINEALKKLFEGETLEPKPVEVAETTERSLPQKIIAIEEEMLRENISVPTRTIVRPGPSGWATSDVYVPNETASAGEVLEAISKAQGGGAAAGGAVGPSEFGPKAETMTEQGGIIPTIIKPPDKASSPLDIEAAELEDVAAEPTELLRKYPPLDDLLTVRMLTYHAPGEADGYFMVVVEPRRDRSKFDILAKDIIFVIDSSSSIQPAKLARYVAGLQQCVAALNPDDRFDVVEFKTEPNRMAGRLVPATKARLTAAKFFLSSRVSSGNTNVYGAVQGLVGTRPDPDRPYMIFLVTDGRANRGVVENRNIINQVAAMNKNQAAIYSFAGGAKFNEYLLDLLSYRNKGESRFERTRGKVAESLFGFYEEVRDPILLNLRFQVGTVSDAEVYPKVLPDFFLKSRITICGRYRDEAEFSMQILGDVNGTTKEFIFKQRFDQPGNGDEAVARQWAFQKIYYLIGRMVEQGEDDATIAEIRALGAKYAIQTPYYE